MSTISGNRPGTRTTAEDREQDEIAGRRGRRTQGKLSEDPRGVFEERQKAGPQGERDFSSDPARAGQASRKMNTRR
jgi:hypothetical protein